MLCHPPPPASTPADTFPRDFREPTPGADSPENDDHVEPRDVPKLVKLSDSTIRRLRLKGLFVPPVRLTAGRIVWRRQSLLDWLAAREGGR